MSENPLIGFTAYRLEDPDTKQDYIMVQFPRTGQRNPSTLADRPSLLHRPVELMARLVDAGAAIPEGTSPRDLALYVTAKLAKEVGLFSFTTGWKKDANGWAFLLPSGAIGNLAAPMVLGSTEHCLATGSAGTLEGWRKGVALPARPSMQASAAILAAFAAPLLNFSELPEAFVLNWFGNSSSGKTTANRAAASVWGNPTRTASWNASDRSLEEIAAANCDLPLILDDAEQAAKDSDKRMGKLHAASHLIASGIGKSYSKTVTSQLGSVKFRCLGLSSSPVSVERSVSRTDGDRVRFLEVAVAHGDQGGIWALHSPVDPAAASERLTNAANSNYGVAGAAWVEFLVRHQDSLKNRVSKYSAKYLKKLNTAGSVEKRIAKKCALLYAAGRLAIEAKVLPWAKADVFNVVTQMYNSIIHSALGERFDVDRAVSGLAISIADKHQFSRIVSTDLPDVKQKDEVSGYRLSDKKRVWVGLDAFKRALAKNFKEDYLSKKAFAEVVAHMQSEKALLVGHGQGLTQDVRIGGGKRKMIVIDVAKLDALIERQAKGQIKKTELSKTVLK